MTTYTPNHDGIDKAHQLIDAHQYVLESSWGDAQPDSDEENAKIDRSDTEEFGLWHLAVEPAAGEDTKEHYAFPYGDFQRVHRSALIAAKSRAAQNGHDAIVGVADELLTHLDDVAGD
jgi:hypothetical protein